MVAGAQYFRLTRDVQYLGDELPRITAIVRRLSAEIGPRALLPRERYSSDIADHVYSAQGQTLVWQGLLAMSRVWACRS